MRIANDPLREALVDAGLHDVDVAERLGVDPKTVQRWLSGRLPQRTHRWELARLVHRHEQDLWPQLGARHVISPELHATYPHRQAVPRSVWLELFGGAQSEIAILVYSGLFLAEDVDILRLLRQRAQAGVAVRLALGDPDSPSVARRGAEEGIGDSMAAKVRNAIVLYNPLVGTGNVEIRLHGTVLYNSLFRADNVLLVNHHVFGLGAPASPVLHLNGVGELSMAFQDSFERVWASARPLQ
jgi:hypothetical protein